MRRRYTPILLLQRRHRCGRDNAPAAHTRPEWWHRPRARTINAHPPLFRRVSASAGALDRSCPESRSSAWIWQIFSALCQPESSRASCRIDQRHAPPHCRSGWRPRWSPAGRYRSSRQPAPGSLRGLVRPPAGGVVAPAWQAKVARFSHSTRQGGRLLRQPEGARQSAQTRAPRSRRCAGPRSGWPPRW